MEFPAVLRVFLNNFMRVMILKRMVQWKFRVVADVWEKDVWDFQAKSGSSGFWPLGLHFLGKLTATKKSGQMPVAQAVGNIPVTTTNKISQKRCDTNGRRIAIQMGGVLRYKWEEY